MPLYLTKFSYTPATWAKLIKNPEDRRAAARQYIEAVDSKLHGFWYALATTTHTIYGRRPITSPWPPRPSQSTPGEP